MEREYALFRAAVHTGMRRQVVERRGSFSAKTLLELTQDADPNVREAAILSLSDASGPMRKKVVDSLFEIAWNGNETSTMRKAAAMSLANYPNVKTRLAELLGSGHTDLRQTVEKLLGGRKPAQREILRCITALKPEG